MPHHTLLHIDREPRNDTSLHSSNPPSESVSSNAATGPSSILMTCRIMVHAPDGSTTEVRAPPIQGIASFDISPIHDTTRKLSLMAVIVQKVTTCDLPLHPVLCDIQWKHLTGLRLADPHFNCPGKI